MDEGDWVLLIKDTRGRPVQLELPVVQAADGVSDAVAVIVEGMAAGDITPEEAATISSVLEARRKAIETQELAERISRLEQQTPPP